MSQRLFLERSPPCSFHSAAADWLRFLWGLCVAWIALRRSGPVRDSCSRSRPSRWPVSRRAGSRWTARTTRSSGFAALARAHWLPSIPCRCACSGRRTAPRVSGARATPGEPRQPALPRVVVSDAMNIPCLIVLAALAWRWTRATALAGLDGERIVAPDIVGGLVCGVGRTLFETVPSCQNAYGAMRPPAWTDSAAAGATSGLLRSRFCYGCGMLAVLRTPPPVWRRRLRRKYCRMGARTAWPRFIEQASVGANPFPACAAGCPGVLAGAHAGHGWRWAGRPGSATTRARASCSTGKRRSNMPIASWLRGICIRQSRIARQ